jgi:hypothetical protein
MWCRSASRKARQGTAKPTRSVRRDYSRSSIGSWIVRGQKERERILKKETERQLRREKAARLREQRLVEAQAARARAEASPLASLQWESGNTGGLDRDTVLVADLSHGDSTVTDTAEPSSLPFPMSPARREAVRVLGSNGRQKSEDESRAVPLTEPVAIPA